MHPIGYELDTASGRFIRQDAVDPALAGDIVLAPGELADIAYGGDLQDILTAARDLAAERFGPTGEANLIGSLWSLHEAAGVLLIRWRSITGFHRFASIVEEAWKANSGWAFIHYISTEPQPLCWSAGLDPFDERYARTSA